MEYLREYTCQDGNGKDRLIHSRMVTHVEGDHFGFCVIAEGEGQRDTLMFTHDEFQAIVAQYERFKPITTGRLVLSGWPANFLRNIQSISRRYSHLRLREPKEEPTPPP